MKKTIIFILLFGLLFTGIITFTKNKKETKLKKIKVGDANITSRNQIIS